MNDPPEDNEKSRTLPFGYRMNLASLIILLSTAYTALIVLGLVPETRRVDNVNLAILVLAAVGAILLLSPQVFTRLKLFQMLGFKVELGEVKEKQAKQEDQLRDIDLILPILFPTQEREYLLNLGDNIGKSYQGSHSLRTDLRRLRSVDLIKMRPGKTVAQMQNGASYDPKKYVELTALGEHWVRKLIDIEKAKTVDDNVDCGTVVEGR